jgi:hypothetical protein
MHERKPRRKFSGVKLYDAQEEEASQRFEPLTRSTGPRYVPHPRGTVPINKLAIQRIRRVFLHADRGHATGRSTVLHRPSLLTCTRMVRHRPQVWATRSLRHKLIATLLVVVASLTGCASLSPSLGIRPPRPDATYGVSTVDPCMRLDAYVNYSRDLQEAYHSRASQNRWWIYVAGTLGLATIAVSGGLAAAAASTTAIAIVAISGGFTSSFFAFLGNDVLAGNYTAAANSVDDAIAAAAVSKADADRCAEAYVALVKGVSAAATQLEEDRTMSAADALKRANAEKATLSRQKDIALRDLQAAQTESSIALPRLPPSITGIDPSSINPASPVPVTLTVSNVNDNITRFDLKVKLDGVAIQVDAPPAATDRPNVYKVKFMPPKDPPSPQPPDGYSPELVVQGLQGSVTIRGNVKLKYTSKP